MRKLLKRRSELLSRCLRQGRERSTAGALSVQLLPLPIQQRASTNAASAPTEYQLLAGIWEREQYRDTDGCIKTTYETGFDGAQTPERLRPVCACASRAP